MKLRRVLFSASAALVAAAVPMHAQIAITPLLGGYVPASNVNQVSGDATNIAKTRDGTLALGGNIEFGALRGSVMFASGTTIKNANKAEIGKGSVLAAAADLVIRPIPRVFAQPYLVAGAGQKFYKYDKNSLLANNADDRDFALHGGIGADVNLGSVGVVAELTDFLSKGAENKWNVHDAFLMVGLKLHLGQ